MQNENNNDESNNKNNYKELDINDIENMPIKDSNNILEKNSNQKESLVSKEKIEINFDRLYQDLKDSETEAIQTRIESYELKGFNAMEPTIENTNEIKLEKTSISTILDEKNIDLNYIDLMKINRIELEEFKNWHYMKIKIKQNIFDKIVLDSCEINKYGNINLINCIYMLTKKDKNYFQNLFINFDTENEQNLFQLKYYQNGQEENILIDNKVIKNTMFIKPDDTNLWIYLIEKAMAKIYKHYINTYNLLSSELFTNLSPFNIKVYHHIYYEKKEIYNEIKNNINKENIIFCEKDSLEISEIDDVNNLFISFFINNIFKVNGRKYVELYLPYNKSNIDQKEIKIYSTENDIHKKYRIFP